MATRALRWATANADGVAIDRPGRIYCARLVGMTTGTAAEIVAVLRDGGATDPPILALDVVGGAPDDWPGVPVSLPFKERLYVAFTGGSTTTRLLLIGWDTD